MQLQNVDEEEEKVSEGREKNMKSLLMPDWNGSKRYVTGHKEFILCSPLVPLSNSRLLFFPIFFSAANLESISI